MLLAGVFVANVAHVCAQASATEKAAAEALFDAGLSLMREGNYPEACGKLEQSQAIESGIGTQMYLAECYAKLGRIASAWATFREAASAAAAQGQAQRAELATQRAEELKPKLAFLVVQVPPETSGLEGLAIEYDQQAVLSELWGVPMPVDPGEHVVTAAAPGHQSWSGQVVVQDSATVTLTVPTLAAELLAAEPSPALSGQQAPMTSTTSSSDPGSTQRLAGWIVGGVGLVALGVGSYFGIQAISRNSDAEASGCSGQFCDSQDGLTLTRQALDAASLSNLFVTGGLVLVVTSAALHLFAPSVVEQPRAVQVYGGVALDGRGGHVSILRKF